MKSKRHPTPLWNLLLGILDKATLTLGDNRKVDFSAAMVFLTSNLGAAEMSSLVSPRLGFHVPSFEDPGCNAKLSARISRRRHRGRPPKVHAGVHQPSGQNRSLQISG